MAKARRTRERTNDDQRLCHGLLRSRRQERHRHRRQHRARTGVHARARQGRRQRVRAQHRSTRRWQRTREMVEAEGVRYEFMQADITAAGTPKRIVDTCVDQFGSVDILVNSAGVCPLAEVLDFGRQQWDATVQVNLTAAFEMSYEVAQRMVPQRSGKIINICSMFTFLGGRLSPAYCGDQARHRRAHEGLLRRARRAQHPGQRDRPRLLRNGDHGQHPEQPGHQPPGARPHPRRPMGRAVRSDGHRRVPRQPRLGLRQRAHPRRRRRLPRPLGRGSTGRMMHGPYLVGVDCGTQSAKVVVYDATGNAVARGQHTAADEPAAPRRGRPPRRRPVGIDRRGEP